MRRERVLKVVLVVVGLFFCAGVFPLVLMAKEEPALAYAVTIHKSQGSEFPAVVIPLATQHYMLLQRNLIYTSITRGKRLLVLIGQKKALGIAVRNDRPQRRFTGLLDSLRGNERHVAADPSGGQPSR